MEELIERTARKLIDEFTKSPFEWATDKENVGDMQLTIGIVHGINALADALKEEVRIKEEREEAAYREYLENRPIEGGTSCES